MQFNAIKCAHTFNPLHQERVFDVRLVLGCTVYFVTKIVCLNI